MTTESTPDPAPVDSATMNPRRVLMGLVLLAVVAVGGWFIFNLQARNRDSEDALRQALADNEQLRKQMANLEATVADIKLANMYEREKQALAKDETAQVVERAERVHRTLQSLADRQTQWNSRIEELKDNATGKRIAGDPALVDLLATILSSAPEAGIADQLRGRLAPMQAQLRDALEEESVAFKPTEEFLGRVTEIAATAAQTDTWYRDHLLQLDALRQQADGIQPATRTLRAALLAREAERAQQRVETLAARNREIQRQKDEAIGAAEAEAQRIIAEAEAQAKRLVGEATAANIKQAALEEKAKQEEAIRQRQAAEKLTQLKREFQRDLSDIKVKLQPFITTGYTYNGDTGRRGPVSLAVLRGQGALDEGRKGLEKLLYIGGTTTNDRQRGGFPQYVGSEFAWRQLNKDFLVKAQDYLNKYGELLIEAGLLAK